MYKSLLCLVAFATVAFAFIPKPNCKVNEDCGDGECCVPLDRYMIASKRDIVGLGMAKFDPFNMEGGVCHKYITEGATCHTRGFTSCGCTPGLTCKFYPQKDLLDEMKEVSLGKRAMMFRPGTSACETAKPTEA